MLLMHPKNGLIYVIDQNIITTCVFKLDFIIK